MTSQTETPKDEGVLEEAKNFLVQGKRFMALGDYQSATDHLEQATQLYDAYYGVGKIQCADAYLEYGLALVALANLEAGSGTDKIMKKAGIEEEDEEEEEDGEEDEEVEGGNDDGMDEGGEKERDEGSDQNGLTQKEDNNHTTETNGQVAMETSNSASSQEHAKNNGVSAEPTPGTSSDAAAAGGANEGADGETEEENEASTIEIAWEVLCLAKRLFMTDESLEGRLKLAETYQKLGEISIEWDNNDNAVDILTECLTIRKSILPPEDRLIASTYYHLGLAHSFKSEIQSANENFQNAIDVIQKRIESLSRDLAKAKENQDTIVVSSYEKEINELKELLPDITMRMDDSKEDQEKSTEVLKRTRDELQNEDEQVKKVLLDTSKPVDDISHLVKRKAT